MTEKQYRIQRLKEIHPILKGKKIALYGTGKNAEAILDELCDLDIVALIDQNDIGKYRYGKKVLSLDAALFLDLDTIIIAAESRSEQEITDRIASVCRNNRIELLNMYGINVYQGIKDNIIQDILYKDFSAGMLESLIDNCETVCFELMEVLCESKYYSPEIMWKRMEDEQSLSHFYKNRCLAEKQRNPSRIYDISEIYSRYLANTFSELNEVIRLRELEEEYFINSIVLKKNMIELLKGALEKGKAVFIVSDLPYTDKVTCRIKKILNLPSDIRIIQENFLNQTISGGMLRTGLGDNFGKKTLYVGKRGSLGYHVTRSYKMDCCMIKGSWEFLKDLTEIPVLSNKLEEEKAQAYKEWGIKAYNSPFFKKDSVDLRDCPQVYCEEDDLIEDETISLPEFSKTNGKENFECLSFVENREIKVSIIIPAHNHFEYTYTCLRSILKNTIKVNYEILIADDCSTDATAHMEDIVEGVKVIHNTKNLMFLKNCNNASKYARGKYILFLNNDTQVMYNWLYPLVLLLDNDEQIGLTGSKLIFPNGRIQEAGGIVWSDGSAANYGRNKGYRSYEYNYVKEVDYISGASFMIRKSLWEEIGGFDERYAPAYYEDTDLAFEVRKHGKKVIYQPASVVVHFEGISNGKDVQEGVKKYQEINRLKFAEKWKKELLLQNNSFARDVFAARERKGNKKTVLFISGIIPSYDRDAGSKSILNYMKLFLKKGYLVKFLPMDFYNTEPYTFELQQMGIEVLYGSQMKDRLHVWIIENQKNIDYAFINYPDCAHKIIDLLRLTTIKIRYYGHDLHFLRLKREYEISHNENTLQSSEMYLKKEKELIEKAECVYYPSEVEVQIVKKQFGKECVKQISLFMFEENEQWQYSPAEREGMMFIGGSHPPNKDAMMWFLKEIYPDIYNARRIPFYLVGSGQFSELKHLNVEGLINLGYVTEEELLSLYHKVRMVVIPLRYGAGIKGKVLDALYHGVPVVSTSIGIEGIPESEHVIGASDTAEAFKNRILELYDNYQELRNISDKSKNIVANYFSLETAWKKIEEDF